ncbi:hypothetical protein CDL12_22105 [Handroanthus impetiginosus]|uniref:Uncharacterized protein n=1 Tax=Handroanthus impetiginosus TaxID=429701 RepID=A0A2G9GJC0_9LAMI|nr:hypothetical protein CDL12_22105 [Handroanthus impetiginosus]
MSLAGESMLAGELQNSRRKMRRPENHRGRSFTTPVRRKIDVDNRFSLCLYYRMIINLLKQIKVFRRTQAAVI